MSILRKRNVKSVAVAVAFATVVTIVIDQKIEGIVGPNNTDNDLIQLALYPFASRYSYTHHYVEARKFCYNTDQGETAKSTILGPSEAHRLQSMDFCKAVQARAESRHYKSIYEMQRESQQTHPNTPDEMDILAKRALL